MMHGQKNIKTSKIMYIFPHPSRLALEPTQPPIQQVPGIKRPERDVHNEPSSTAEVKKRIELCILPLCDFMECEVHVFTYCLYTSQVAGCSRYREMRD